VGYDPELKVEQTDVDPRTLLQGIQQDGEITLTFQYPRQERIIATIIRQELERYGIRVIPTEIKNQDYEKALLQRTTDLNLIPLDFDIGDIGPFLDALIDSKSPFNKTYSNPKVDELVYASRTELNRVKRLKLLQELMTIIVHEDPAGIPLLFKRSFMAEKEQEPVSWWQAWLQKKVLGWE
jgi:ABC-type transport system substrate-binding protein